jgi:hypothetical protein
MEHYYCYVYALIDPRGEQVRYIGKVRRKAKNGHLHRWAGHIKEARLDPDKTHKSRWIASLLREGLSPELRVLDALSCSAQELSTLEISRIAEYRALGFDLTNTTDGGDGGRGRLSDEQKKLQVARLVAANTGAKRSAESRQRMREAWLRRDADERAATLKKATAAAAAKPISEETRQKLRNAQARRRAKS